MKEFPIKEGNSNDYARNPNYVGGTDWGDTVITVS